MNGLTEFIKTIGPGRVAAMVAVAALLIGFFAFVITRWSQPQMATLLTEVSVAESGAIVRELERLQVRHQVSPDGQTIQVAREDLARARMRLAEQGLPRGGGVGYEIFDRGEALGTTSFVQNLNHLRALEGELARSIRSIERVQQVRVHLVVPERQIFARERQEPTASIVVRLRGGLEQPQVRAIQHLVASAVPGMKPQNVSIVDEGGRLLASGRGEGEAMAAAGIEERRLAQEGRLRREVEDILTRVVGPGRSRVQVAAELDYSRITQTQDLFDPDMRVTRSTQTRSERSASQDGQNRQVTVGNELPAAQRGQAEGQSQRENSEKNEEVVNYEIGRTQRQEVTEPGRLRRVSVAVLVDGLYRREGDTLVYDPRPQEELDRIAALVRSAVGFDERRGDKVEVVNLRFASGPPVETLPAEPTASPFSFTRDELFRMAEMGVLVLLTLLALLFVVRPLVKRMLADAEPAPALAGPAGALPAGAALEEALAATAGEAAGAAGSGEAEPVPEHPTARAIEMASLSNEMHSQAVGRVAELVKANPNEATAIIRGWMSERQAA